MPEEHNDHQEMQDLLEENRKLLNENNAILKKIHRNGKWSLWLRIAWYALLLGLPVAIYFLFGPIFTAYFDALGSDYDKFQEGMRELPGFKTIDNAIGGGGE